MSNVSHTSTRILVGLILATACCAVPQTARAQADVAIEMLRRNPATGLTAKAVSGGKEMLNWQIERGKMQMELLKRQIQDQTKVIEHQEADVSEIAKQSRHPELAIASKENREQLIGHTLQRLLDARVDIAAHEALVEHLVERTADVKKEANSDRVPAAQLDAARAKLELLQRRNQRLKSLIKEKLATPDELFAAEVEAKQAEAELVQIEHNKMQDERLRASAASVPLADARMHLHELKTRESTSAAQLRQLAEATATARKLQQRTRVIERLQQRLDLYSERLYRVEMEVEEARLLLMQVETEAKKAAEKAKE